MIRRLLLRAYGVVETMCFELDTVAMLEAWVIGFAIVIYLIALLVQKAVTP